MSALEGLLILAGMPVAVLELPHAAETAVLVAVRGGPAYDPQPGVTHFLEHTMLRGTADHPDSHTFHTYLDNLTASIEGVTYRDSMTLALSGPSEAAPQLIQALGQIVARPAFQPTGIDLERKTIEAEIKETLNEDGCETDIDALGRPVLWPAPLGQSITGTCDDVRRLRRTDLVQWHRRLFQRANVQVVVAGPHPKDELLGWVRRAFADLPVGAVMPRAEAPTRRRHLPVVSQVVDQHQYDACWAWPFNPRDSHLAVILSHALAGSFGTPLQQRLSEQSGLAYAHDATVDVLVPAAAFDITATFDPENLAEGVAVIKNLCTSRGWLTPQLVQAAKRRAVFNRSVAYTQPVQIVSDVAEDVMMGRAWQKDQVIAALERVTPLEVQAFAAKLFDPAHSLLTVVGPDGLDEGALLKLVR